MQVTRETLNDFMEFDRPVRVHDDGTVTYANDVIAPAIYDTEAPEGWTLLNGYSGQDGYGGPGMHTSEYIGGRMADDILATPGVYVALVDYDSSVDPDDDDADDMIGWVVAKLDS